MSRLPPFAALAMLIVCCRSVVAETPPAPPVLPSQQALRKMVWDENFSANVNVRYWDALAEAASRNEWRLKICSCVLAVITLALPLLFPSKRRDLKMIVINLVTLAATCVSVVVLLDTSATSSDLATIKNRWNSLASEWKLVMRDRDSLAQPELRSRVDALIAQQRDLENSEPAATDHPAMHAAWQAEVNYCCQDKSASAPKAAASP